MLALLAETSSTAHLVQMVDSTIVRAYVSAAGTKGGRTRHLQRLGPAAQGAMVRHREIEAKQLQDGAD